MNIPNENKVPFREMTKEERGAIVEQMVADCAQYYGSSGDWFDACGSIQLNEAYRTKPRQLIIPWDVIKPEYNWAAMDKNGEIMLYATKPNDGEEYWKDGMCNVGCYCLNIDTTGIDWRESLVQRPEGV